MRRCSAEWLWEALQLVQTAEASGTIVTLPVKWADVRRAAKLLSEQGKGL
jgi:hypothetical protein